MDVVGAMDVGAEEVTGAFDGRDVCAVTEGERMAAGGLCETTGWSVAVSDLTIPLKYNTAWGASDPCMRDGPTGCIHIIATGPIVNATAAKAPRARWWGKGCGAQAFMVR